jgi:GcrA cell cycle regulator
MGITKNAVIGKARRLGLPAREAPANIAKQTGVRVRQKAQPLAGRDASFPRQSRPATIPGVSSAVERRVASLPVENLPEAVAETPPPRVFSGTECCHPMGDRTCNEPVQANARGLKSSYCPEHFAIIHAAPPAKSANNPPPAGWIERGPNWTRGKWARG